MRWNRSPILYRAAVRWPRLVLTGVLLVTVLAGWGAQRLRLGDIFSGLFPEGTESVANLELFKQEFGEPGYLVITAQHPDQSKVDQFAARLATELESIPDVYYASAGWNTDFIKERFWLYVDVEDLELIKQRIDHALQLQAQGVSPVFNDLMSFADPEDRPNLNFDDIIAKYEQRYGFNFIPAESADAEPMALVWVKAKHLLIPLSKKQAFVEKMHVAATTLGALPQFRGIALGFTGNYQTSLDSVAYTEREILRVSLVVGALLLLLLLFYFRRVDAVLLIGACLAVAVLWTGGLTYVLFGQLNLLTGFAAAILAGLGSDYGIYLLSRYYLEREQGHDVAQAIREAFGATGKATYAAMITTLAAFIGLCCSDLNVFVEFGLVGASGLAMTYVAMMLIMPSALMIGVRLAHVQRLAWFTRVLQWGPPRVVVPSGWAERLLRPRHAVWVVTAAGLLCAVSLFSIPTQARIGFESGQVNSLNIPSNALYDEVSTRIDATLNPTILISSDASQERRTMGGLVQVLDATPHDKRILKNVIGLSSFVPTEQAAKQVLLANILEKTVALKTPETRKRKQLLADLRSSLATEPISAQSLPSQIRKVFESPGMPLRYATFVFPAISRVGYEDMLRYQNGLNRIKGEQELNFKAVDASFIAVDAIRRVSHEAPRALLYLFAFFLVILWFRIRPWTQGVIILANLAGAAALLCGVTYLLDIHFNILNIAAIPIVLGTGIDCFLHLTYRYQEQPQLAVALREEMPPILLSSLTSIIAFGGLLWTSHGGLRSLGGVAVLGLILVTLMCVFIFSRCLFLQSVRQESHPEILGETAEV